MASCPECRGEVEVDEFDVDAGDQLSCPGCGASLEVVNVTPTELRAEPDDDPDESDEADSPARPLAESDDAEEWDE